MKIFDCITYFNEPMIFDLRLNILNKYVDEFIVCEATYTHRGDKKKINFNKNLYPKFKNRIKHLIVDKEPQGLYNLSNTKDKKYLIKNHSKFRLNAAKRIEMQRDEISKLFDSSNYNDWILYSDSDEIPNLKKINLKKEKSKIILFDQKVFYYRFNLHLPNHRWFGTKACRFKDLTTISNLRNIKTKKYNWWRLDTLFKKDKFINLKIVKDGGWHFTELKSAKEILIKHKNDEHHDEFDLTGITENDIKKMINEHYIPYDHSIDQREFEKKWNKSNKIRLNKVNNDILPNYLIKKQKKYAKWFV
jgi:beta-1,4-mannosyl-glycoprotein beta-1,4-N-acetylglucosaminyltransferase